MVTGELTGWRSRGVALLLEGRLEEAFQLLRRDRVYRPAGRVPQQRLEEVLEEHPGWSWGRLQLALRLAAGQRWKDVIDLLQPALTDGSPDDPFHAPMLESVGDAICRSAPDPQTAARLLRHLCEGEIERHGETASALLYLGQAAFCADDYENAVALFQRSVALGGGVLPGAGGARTLREGAFCIRLETEKRKHDILPEMRFDAPFDAGDSDSFVVVIACDGSYLEIYGDLYLGWLRRLAPEVLVHLHLVDPGDAAVERMASLRRSMAPLRVNWSWERRPLTGPRRFYAPYLASARFLRAPALLDHYRRGLLITDMDAVFKRSPFDLSPVLQEADVGLRLRLGRCWFPWRSIPAQTVYLRNNDRGRRFANLLSRYIATLYDPDDGRQWWIDQSAIYAVYHHLAQADPATRWVDLLGPTKQIIDIARRDKDEFLERHRRRLAKASGPQ